MSLAGDLNELPPRLRALVVLGMLSGMSRYEVAQAILKANDEKAPK